MNTHIYNGPTPVDSDEVREWFVRGLHRVRIEFVASVMDMVNVRDVDEWNERVDEWVGVSLCDVTYGFVHSLSVDDVMPPEATVMFVEGVLDSASYRYAVGEH